MKAVVLLAAFLVVLAIVRVDVAAAKTNAKVLILGAGVAGLQAANTLKEKGVDDIILIEAENHVGGRLVTGSAAGMPTDGAFWETDTKYPERNTLGQMLEQCNVDLANIGLSTRVFVDEYGKDVSTQAEARMKELTQKINNLKTDWTTGLLNESADLNMHAAVRLHGWHPQNSVDVAVEGWVFDSFLAPTEQSAANYLYLYAGPNGYSVNQKYFSTGLGEVSSKAKLVNCMRDLVFSASDERLVLGARVTDVSYASSGVTVTVDGGQTYRGDYAIVTFSLGVLQRESVAFRPPLPYAKRLVVNEFPIIPLTIVWARFDRLVDVDGARYRFYVFANDHRLNWHWGRDVGASVQNATYDIIRFWIWGEPALRIERQSYNETLQELNELTTAAFGVAPVSVHVSSVNYDPLYGGCCRGWPIGVTFAEFDLLRAPIADRLFFAGDAYQIPIYARAASISGKETASIVVDCMNGKSCAYPKFNNQTATPCPTGGAVRFGLSLASVVIWALAFAACY